MEETAPEYIKATIRQDIVDVLGENLDTIIESTQMHMLDALSTALSLKYRFSCMPCMHTQLLESFFQWLNEEAYVHIVNDFDYQVFIHHVVKWTMEWADKECQSPCTDNMPSTLTH